MSGAPVRRVLVVKLGDFSSFVLASSTRPAPPEILLLIGLGTLGLGTLVTGVTERVGRRSRAGCLVALAFIAAVLIALAALLDLQVA